MAVKVNRLVGNRVVSVFLTLAIILLLIVTIEPFVPNNAGYDWSEIDTISYEQFELDASGDFILKGTVTTSLLDDAFIIEMVGSFQVNCEDRDITPFMLYPKATELQLICGEYNGNDIAPVLGKYDRESTEVLIILLSHNTITPGQGNFIIKLSYEKGAVGDDESQFTIWLFDSHGKKFSTTVNFGEFCR